jgi:hypothetical protein
VTVEREEELKIRKTAPPTRLLEEERKIVEGLRKAGKVAEEVARRIATGLERTAERVSEVDVPRLTRNILMLATTGATVYLMASAIGVMAPQAIPVWAQLGAVLGYMIPLMFMSTVFMIMISLAKHLVR